MNEQQLTDAIQAFYGDTSRSREQTKEGLESARDLIDTLVESLHDDEE